MMKSVGEIASKIGQLFSILPILGKLRITRIINYYCYYYYYYLGGYFTHRLHHIYYHSFLWLIWALPSCSIFSDIKSDHFQCFISSHHDKGWISKCINVSFVYLVHNYVLMSYISLNYLLFFQQEDVVLERPSKWPSLK